MLNVDPNSRPSASELLNDPLFKLSDSDKPLDELPLLSFKANST